MHLGPRRGRRRGAVWGDPGPSHPPGKKGKVPTPQEAIQRLRETEELLLKKQEFLETKIQQELVTARKHGTKNKRGELVGAGPQFGVEQSHGQGWPAGEKRWSFPGGGGAYGQGISAGGRG